ncbi:LysR family transcriptional regulator [Geminicoccus roseus]|uniref:LysR family transcriptional regulator n=1 Tax=Geminicoccus roseus TaxID=404900 RepID=UPI0004116600|nr:LysR family transcriptional regulator [Geminicoccus roseus]
MTMPDLDPDLLKAFVAVAEQRSFTRAALALHRTQSAVSMQIRRLEERLEVDLFHRTTVQVELSPAGERLLGYARRILVLGEEAVGRLRAHKVEGLVRLGVMDDHGTLVLPAILAGFAGDYPHIRLEMETGLTATMPDRLGSAFDLVLALHPEGQAAGQFVRREQAVWATGLGHETERQDPVPLALYPGGCLLRRYATEALDREGRPWRIAFVSHSLAAVEAVAAQGLAVTVVKAATFPDRLRRLGEAEGMPALPGLETRLHRAPNLPRAAALLADHLVAAMQHPG